MEILHEHVEELRQAKEKLENMSLAIQVTNMIGRPIEAGMEKLPAKYREPINRAVHASLNKSVEILSATMKEDFKIDKKWYKTAAAATGFGGGFFGIAALTAELPLSTLLMLRSIMEIADNNGENLEDVSTRMACLEVFALGGTSHEDDAAETGYYAVRIGLSRAMTEAAKYVAERGLAAETAPPIVRFINQIAVRYGIVVSDKAAAQLIPILGGLSGAAINLLFMDHFQKIAEGHFTIRRLERIYPTEVIQDLYSKL